MLLPPTPLIARGVILRVMDGAKRHSELVAHLEAESLAGQTGRDEHVWRVPMFTIPNGVDEIVASIPFDLPLI